VAVTVSGLLLLVVFTLVGLPFRSLLALLGGIAHIVPSLGPALGLLPALFVALTISPLTAVLTLVGAAAVQALVRTIVRRMLRAQAVLLVALIQVVLILMLADVGGFLAIIFGPPLAALLQVLYINLLAASTTTQSRDSVLDMLVERLNRLRADARPQNLELVSILQRSDDLFRQANELLDEREPAGVK